MKKIYKLNPMSNFFDALTLNDEPPTLYSLMESYVNYNSEVKTKIIDLPQAFREYLFDFDYPLDNSLKPSFEENFLTHYMMRRIGFETYMSFKIHLKDKLNTIMPKYNKLLLEFNNIDFKGVKEIHSRSYRKNMNEIDDKSNNETTTGTSDNINDNRFSSLPQNEINDVKDGSYMTDYTYNTSSGRLGGSLIGTTSGRKQNDENYIETIEIDKGDPTDEYMKLQDKINNVYELIYKDLNCLFFQVV